jgi:hypothetical protein
LISTLLLALLSIASSIAAAFLIFVIDCKTERFLIETIHLFAQLNPLATDSQVWRASLIVIASLSVIDNMVALIVAAVAVCSPVSPIQGLWTPAAMETRPFPAPEGTILLRSIISSSTYSSE